MVAFPPQGTGSGNTLTKTGTATILANTSSVTVNHTLAGVPKMIKITPTNDFASQGATVPTASINAVSFQIAFAFGATQPADATFEWEATQ